MPIIFSNIGQIIVTLTDTLMVGYLGAVALSVVAFSGMVINVFMVLCLGYTIGLSPLVAKRYVRGNEAMCVRLFKNSIFSNFILGLIITIVLFSIYPFLYLLDQPQEVIDSMSGYYFFVVLSIIPYVVFLSFKQFLEGLGNTSVSMVISLICNVLNIVFNYLLIFGEFGFPEMGVTGAAVATFISRLSMPILFYIYQRYSRFKHLIPRVNLKGVSSKIMKSLMGYSLPISLQMLFEFSSLTVIAIMMGWLGLIELAANQITYSIMSVMYFVVSGISSAVTILTAFEYGKREYKQIMRVACVGVLLSIIFMSISSISLVTFGEYIASFFTSDMSVITMAASYMFAIGAAQIFDGIQVTFLGALRGVGDVKAPMYFAFFMYDIACISVAYIFGFVLEWGGVGVWLGFAVGLMLASLLYGLRLRYTILSKANQQ